MSNETFAALMADTEVSAFLISQKDHMVLSSPEFQCVLDEDDYDYQVLKVRFSVGENRHEFVALCTSDGAENAFVVLEEYAIDEDAVGILLAKPFNNFPGQTSGEAQVICLSHGCGTGLIGPGALLVIKNKSDSIRQAFMPYPAFPG